MQTRGERDYPGGPRGPQRPISGDQRMLPHFVEKEQERQAHMPTDDEYAGERMSIGTLFATLWPLLFWLYGLMTAILFGKVLFGLGTTYDWFNHLLITVISIGSVAGLVILWKWVICAPDGLPWQPRQ